MVFAGGPARGRTPSSYWTELNRVNTAKMPSAKPKSPTRLTMKALMAAALAAAS